MPEKTKNSRFYRKNMIPDRDFGKLDQKTSKCKKSKKATSVGERPMVPIH